MNGGGAAGGAAAIAGAWQIARRSPASWWWTTTGPCGSEWAGATFEPMNGNWLFVNIQSPGVTFAITGLWRNGAL